MGVNLCSVPGMLAASAPSFASRHCVGHAHERASTAGGRAVAVTRDHNGIDDARSLS